MVEGTLDCGPTINDRRTSLDRFTTAVEAQSARRGFLQTVLDYVRYLVAPLLSEHLLVPSRF